MTTSTSVFSENARIYNAEAFILSFEEPNDEKMYLTIGKSSAWANDSAPPQANTSVLAFNEIWKNMIGAKKIVSSDLRHVIKRNNWTANTVYDMYDDSPATGSLFLDNVKFYILTSEYNVYKCIDNNNNAMSTVMPTQTLVNATIKEVDGYVWKYLYTLNSEEKHRFMTDEYIPVRTLSLDADKSKLQWLVQRNAFVGGIESIKVVSGGSNYINASNIIVTISGDGENATAIASTNTMTNTISSISITNSGQNYTYANVTVTDSDGYGCVLRAIMSPPGGHGSDPVRELGGSNVLINVRLKDSENSKIPTDNEFRQIAIIEEPIERSTGNIASSLAYDQTLTLVVSSSSFGYTKDEIVYQGTSYANAYFTGIVNTWDSSNNIVKLTNTVGTPESDILVGVTTSTARFVEAITEKELTEYTGILLYTDNISPIQRASDQTEDIKIVIRF